MGQPVVEVAAIAPGSTPADALSFKNNHARARFCQLARSTQTREAATNDGHIVMAFDRTLRRPRKQGRRVVPIGDELHDPVLPYSPTTPARPEISEISV
ncbi:hypothetical protein D3C72_2204850 [compost metagenome]